jgi:hypothetical protein
MPLPQAVLRRSLGDGEREALALAVEIQAERILLDDRPARRVAQELQLLVTGTAGILLAAKRHSTDQLAAQLSTSSGEVKTKNVIIGTFGLCIVDGGPIEEQRLDTVPWTPYCPRHEQSLEASSGSKTPTL